MTQKFDCCNNISVPISHLPLPASIDTSSSNSHIVTFNRST